jgi:hypothetical protein
VVPPDIRLLGLAIVGKVDGHGGGGRRRG